MRWAGLRLDTRAACACCSGSGIAVTIGFVLLRATNLYGDPGAWQPQPKLTSTILSFINCEKYPPSLLYLMMTHRAGAAAAGGLEERAPARGDFLVAFGRVPFFFYVVHIYLIHALAVGFAFATMGHAAWLVGAGGRTPVGYGLSLPAVYAVTGLVVALLFPVCRWFAALKGRRHDWWLSYL